MSESTQAAIVIALPGHPRGKGRPRRVRLPNGTYVVHTDAKTREFEANLMVAAERGMAGRPPLDGPLLVLIEAHFPVPASWSKKRRREALAGLIRPTVKPDWNNIGGVTDALNQVAWNDDRQIVDARVIKRYSDRPRLVISIWPLRISTVESRGEAPEGRISPAPLTAETVRVRP